MVLRGNRCQKILAGAVLSIFIFVSFQSPVHATITTENDGPVQYTCPFMTGMSGVCRMSPIEHIAAWQNMFTAIFAQSNFLMMLFLLLALVVGRLLLKHTYKSNPRHAGIVPLVSAHRNRKRYESFLDSLQEAFSNGIIHTKLF